MKSDYIIPKDINTGGDDDRFMIVAIEGGAFVLQGELTRAQLIALRDEINEKL